MSYCHTPWDNNAHNCIKKDMHTTLNFISDTKKKCIHTTLVGKKKNVKTTPLKAHHPPPLTPPSHLTLTLHHPQLGPLCSNPPHPPSFLFGLTLHRDKLVDSWETLHVNGSACNIHRHTIFPHTVCLSWWMRSKPLLGMVLTKLDHVPLLPVISVYCFAPMFPPASSSYLLL